MRTAALLLLFLLLRAGEAQAHSASDAYLTLIADAGAEAGKNGAARWRGQWDIALRDLDFVLHLDDDGDGRLTWAEVRRHQPAIAALAYANLHVGVAGRARCALVPGRQLIDEHADGAYAALFFDVVCGPQHPAGKIVLDYGLFFAIDPSHRGIFVMHDRADLATAVLSPENPRIVLRSEP